MKVAVISFSGNVGKSTIARHLLAPRAGAHQLSGLQILEIVVRDGGDRQHHRGDEAREGARLP